MVIYYMLKHQVNLSIYIIRRKIFYICLYNLCKQDQDPRLDNNWRRWMTMRLKDYATKRWNLKKIYELKRKAKWDKDDTLEAYYNAWLFKGTWGTYRLFNVERTYQKLKERKIAIEDIILETCLYNHLLLKKAQYTTLHCKTNTRTKKNPLNKKNKSPSKPKLHFIAQIEHFACF